MFVDVAKIYVRAGDGGNGSVSFHREKFVAAGGPDGGDGGKGGDVVFVVDPHSDTLLPFQYQRKYIAENGQNGGQKKCFGRGGADMVIKVPLGTLIKDADTGLIIKDMSDEEPFVLLRGGNGGWGNTHFATPTRQVPRFAKPGVPGMEKHLLLELKLLADVGLVGFPNVGKSTFLSMVSAARPKIANYHFTTLSPVLGVVDTGDGSGFVMADIPGIIEGASEGVGLGHAFLRHVDRCRLLVHIVDISGCEGRSPLDDFKIINQEMAQYSETLASRPQIVVGNKADAIVDEQAASAFEQAMREQGYEYYRMSAATRQGVDEVVRAISRRLADLPKVIEYQPETVVQDRADPTDRSFTVEKKEDVYFVEGKWLLPILSNLDLDNRESLQYFQRLLKTSGINDELERQGIQEGDTVVIYDFEFYYVP